jgi:hypothetical protein
MKRKTLYKLLPIPSLMLALVVALVNLSGVVGAQGPVAQDIGTAFTYQGRLNDADEPADGTYDFRFVVYDAASGGSQVGDIVTQEDVTVSDGFFAVELDPGGGVYSGDPRYLEIGVRAGDSTGGFTLLSPLQPLLPAPYAIYAQSAPWSGLADVPDGFADGVDDDVPAGAIIMWSGALSSIPAGWALCDGTNGTPDLRDRFIMGVSQGEDPGATGGSTSHYHTVNPHMHFVDPPLTSTTNTGSHSHGSESVDDCSLLEDCTTVMDNNTSGVHHHWIDMAPFYSESAAPGTSSSTHLPPYFELAFLMKLP